MTKAHKDLEIGFEIEPKTYKITQEKINIFSRYIFYRKDTRDIHTDDKVAGKAGLPRAIAQGRYPIGYLFEFMLNFFRKGWIQGGKLDAALAKWIYPGDAKTIKGRIRDKIQEGSATRFILDVWLENQQGENATVGIASGLVDNG